MVRKQKVVTKHFSPPRLLSIATDSTLKHLDRSCAGLNLDNLRKFRDGGKCYKPFFYSSSEGKALSRIGQRTKDNFFNILPLSHSSSHRTWSIHKSFPELGIELGILLVIAYFLTHSLCATAAPTEHGILLKVFPSWV